MFIHMRKRITTVLFTFTLLATPMIPVYAQDDDPAEPVIAADVNQPAATETMMSAEAVFTTDEPAATDTEPKSARQTTEKLVPNAEEAYAESDAKRHLYLPMITNGSGSGADVEAAATTAYWRTIKYEGFEGAFPNTAWRVSDCNGTNYGASIGMTPATCATVVHGAVGQLVAAPMAVTHATLSTQTMPALGWFMAPLVLVAPKMPCSPSNTGINRNATTTG